MKNAAVYTILSGLFFIIVAGCSHRAAPNGFDSLNDSIVARYNRGDFKGMYALESDSLRATDPEDGYIKYFTGLKDETGKIDSVHHIADSRRHHYFEWYGKKKNERFDIVGDKPGVMADYFVSDFVAQPNSRSGPVKTDNPLKSRLDLSVQQAASIYMSDPMAVGLSIGILQDGKMYTYNYGEVKKGSGILPTADNVYNIGSVAKTFVSTLLAQAVVEGRVKLDDDIRRYLPGSYPNLAYHGHPVRVVNLANHTSGLPGSAITIPPALHDSLMHIPDSLRFAYYAKKYHSFNADSMLRNMHGFTVDTVPGTKYRYNGNAVSVLILLLERIYHQPYEQILQHYLSSHLGMLETLSEFTAENMRKLPQGYNTKGVPMPIFPVSQFITSPSINSTVHDMLKYMQANLLEKDTAVKLTHQVTFSDKQGDSVGLNWMLGKDDEGRPRIFHSGQTGAGFTTYCVFYPTRQTGYIIFVNDMISQGKLVDLQQEIMKNAGQGD
jgi:CubicO group peptidase (beta-lactamase class C family)